MSAIPKATNLIFLALILVLFVGASGGADLATLIRKTNNKLPGQSAPPEMVFIKGNETVASFYIGVTEEPNINYVIYLKWLARIYGADYPSIVQDALPAKPNGEKVCYLGDAYITGYLTNPEYAYAPVVNLTWNQINNYLSWKTNVLNEAILVKKELLKFSTSQVNEPFNTEAYIAGQYDSNRQNYLVATDPTVSYRNLAATDGILFYGFRLPTEEEWEYASNPDFAAIQHKDGKAKRGQRHAFGPDYFLLNWGQELDKRAENYYVKKVLPKRFEAHSIAAIDSIDYSPNAFNKQFSLPYMYSDEHYGLINMKEGVQEWVLDEYNETKVYSNYLDVMKSSGFNVDSASILTSARRIYNRDYKGYGTKDSLGRMQRFIFMGTDSKGDPNEISRSSVDGKIRERVIRGGDHCNPGSQRTKLKETAFSPNVGFRCVLQYTGAPVLTRYKVKW
jgi:hypothetical protein